MEWSDLEITKEVGRVPLTPVFRFTWHNEREYGFDLVLFGCLFNIIYGRAGLGVWIWRWLFFWDPYTRKFTIEKDPD